MASDKHDWKLRLVKEIINAAQGSTNFYNIKIKDVIEHVSKIIY